jgi:hypothetical protein
VHDKEGILVAQKPPYSLEEFFCVQEKGRASRVCHVHDDDIAGGWSGGFDEGSAVHEAEPHPGLIEGLASQGAQVPAGKLDHLAVQLHKIHFFDARVLEYLAQEAPVPSAYDKDPARIGMSQEGQVGHGLVVLEFAALQHLGGAVQQKAGPEGFSPYQLDLLVFGFSLVEGFFSW